jgi:hypothetical protein
MKVGALAVVSVNFVGGVEGKLGKQGPGWHEWSWQKQ